ncbi:MAG: protein-L-isoaspartate(D-aspartate) O-methyltransferase [Spirochaetes bacterium]|nr:protein-L-isoaspartate(D-aspartate) O-methyltransferase [Spirochaetota bacterium]
MLQQDNDAFAIARAKMVYKLAQRGILSEKLLQVFRMVPRHLFVSEALHFRAYEDAPLPIGFGQTMSRPSTVARMIQLLNLNGDECVLEIGTGSGYQSAILGLLAKHVVTVEIIDELFSRACAVLLNQLGFRNIQMFLTRHYSVTEKKYDAIIVSACAEEIPHEYLSQLVPGGRMVIPLRKGSAQVIVKILKDESGKIFAQECGKAFFVPLVRSL